MLFNKDTFSDVMVKSIYLHDTRRVLPEKVMEGDSGWVLQGVLSRSFLRRQPPNGQKTFTVVSLHISNIHAKKRGIRKKLVLTIRAVMLDEKVDLVTVTSTGLHVGATTETTSVPSKRPLLCRSLPAPHHCGTWIDSRQGIP